MDVGYSWHRRLRASIFGTPLYIAAVGLVLTTLVALLQHSSQIREREILFESEVGRIERTVQDAIERQGLEFESSISFNAATHPASLTEYRTFFRREFDITDELDPGVLLVESVHIDDIDDLERRERSLNREDFTVFSPFAFPGEERLIVTRSGRDMHAFGFPLLGLDVTYLASLILPSDIPADGFALRVIEPEPLFEILLSEGQRDETFNGDIEPSMVVLVASVERPGGDLLGYTTRFLDVADLVKPLRNTVPSTMQLQMSVEEIGGPIAQLGGPAIDSPQFAATRNHRTASLNWRIDVRANDDFGKSLGLVEQLNPWLLGLPLSLIAALMVVVSEYHRRRLDEAAFEVEHARALASTDPLTGLLNRQGLIDAARDDVDDRDHAALFFVDLDGFKAVNDEDGHDEGDRVLREVARRLRDICRPQDFVCRLGGDEFVMFTPGVGDEEHMVDVSSRITGALASIDQRVTSSVGVAARQFGEATDVKELLRSADREMYEAKRAGGDRYSVRLPAGGPTP